MKIVPLLFLTFFAVPTSAHFFDWYELFPEEWQSWRYIYFGGCEADDNTTCFDDGDNSSWRGTFFNIGELNVKQGLYYVKTVQDDHGKLILKYSYRYYTDEPTTLTTDVGIIKVKDVETNKLYYYRGLLAADATDEWVDVRVVLPSSALGRQLQLVFEVENDAANVSRMHIDAISGFHRDPYSEINGTVTQEVTGKDFAVEDAIVTIKNYRQTKTYRTTVTDAEGAYVLYPVPRRPRLTLVVEYGDEVLTYVIRNLDRNRRQSVDVEFPEE